MFSIPVEVAIEKLEISVKQKKVCPGIDLLYNILSPSRKPENSVS